MNENVCIRFQSRRRERTENGIRTSLTYSGSYEDILALQNELYPDSFKTGMGRLVSSVMVQETPEIWHLEVLYSTDTTGNISYGPKKTSGSKSYSLSGSLITMPLESAKKYRACWNHYLFAAPGAEDPGFFESAKDTILSGANASKYAWGENVSDCPHGWSVVGVPEKPGVTGVDKATYSITEHIYCSSESSAGGKVAKKLNKTGTPAKTFGIGGTGDWKCDDAQVSWDGECWVAQLTWTLAGDSSGWDPDLYD